MAQHHVETLIDESEERARTTGRYVRTFRHRLLLFAQDTVLTFPLPESGEVVIGRDENADVRVDNPSVSRRHCALVLGPSLKLKDLSSRAGTRLRGTVLPSGEEVELRIGETFELGPVTAVVQRASQETSSTRPRRLWTHDYFESRLEEECARAEATQRSFSVMRLKLEGTATPSVVQEVLGTLLSPTDVVASWGPGEYEVLLLEADGAKVQGVADQLLSTLKSRGAPVAVGVATWARDCRDPDVLLSRANAQVKHEATTESELASSIVVKDPQMERLHTLVKRIAASNISVILMGETGVGKEVFAEAIHRNSPRASQPFLRLNCAALSETLLESELFGHEKGAFTGAIKTKVGLLESAIGGTVMLDEAGELPLSTQVKLLRVIEQREVVRVGDVKPRPIDVRFVAATNRNLEAEIKKGTFRQDLFFRLNGVSLVIPPLRERQAELEGLTKAFISAAAKNMGKAEPTLSEGAMAIFRRYSWPGNIRELRNVIERAVLLCPGRVIDVDLLPAEKMHATPLAQVTRDEDEGGPRPAANLTAWEAERQKILEALEKSGGNQTVAAKLLNISRRTMLNRLDEYDIPRPRKGQAS